jgi:hypothetical protein
LGEAERGSSDSDHGNWDGMVLILTFGSVCFAFIGRVLLSGEGERVGPNRSWLFVTHVIRCHVILFHQGRFTSCVTLHLHMCVLYWAEKWKALVSAISLSNIDTISILRLYYIISIHVR